MSKIELLKKENYISLETYRRNGAPVRTPVWFAISEDNHLLYIRSDTSAGKVKRIRNNSDIKLAPSNGSGTPKAEFISAKSHIADLGSPEFDEGVFLINKKYGFIKKIYDFFFGTKKPFSILVVQITE